MIGGNRRGDVLQHDGLAGPRGGHDQSALAFADRRDQVDHSGGVVLRHALHRRLGDLDLHFQAGGWVKRGQVVKIDAVLDRVRCFEVDFVDFNEGEVALAVFGGADFAVHRVPGAEREAADLGGGDVNIFGAGEVVGFRIAQEAEAIGQNFQRAVAGNRLVVLREGLQDGEHHVLLAQAGGVLDLQLLGKIQQVGGGFGL